MKIKELREVLAEQNKGMPVVRDDCELEIIDSASGCGYHVSRVRFDPNSRRLALIVGDLVRYDTNKIHLSISEDAARLFLSLLLRHERGPAKSLLAEQIISQILEAFGAKTG
jgi:hypothetical protein